MKISLLTILAQTLVENNIISKVLDNGITLRLLPDNTVRYYGNWYDAFYNLYIYRGYLTEREQQELEKIDTYNYRKDWVKLSD